MLEYAIGLINVLEKKTFDKQDMERMLNSPNKEEAFKVLFDTDMGSWAAEEKSLEKLLERDLLSLKKTIIDLTGTEKEELAIFLFLKFDALNLKVALKERLLGKQDMLAFECSVSPFEEIKKKVQKKDRVKNEFVDFMASEVLSCLNSEPDSYEIERQVDRAFLRTRLILAEKIKGLALDQARLEADVSNLKNLVKGRKDFLKGGNLSESDMCDLVGLKSSNFSKNLDNFLEIFNLSRIMKKFKQTGSECDLEKELENFLINQILEKERQRGEGADKIIAYFTRKVNGHSNIRLIFFSKEAGVSLEKVRDNLLPV